MKKTFLFLVLTFILSSCGLHESMSNSIKYQVIDTVYINTYTFGHTEYYVIIKMDSSLYSAKMDKFGNLYEIDNKLKKLKTK